MEGKCKIFDAVGVGCEARLFANEYGVRFAGASLPMESGRVQIGDSDIPSNSVFLEAW